MEGHLLAPALEPDPPQPPYVALLVSGGHTLLVEVRAWANTACWAALDDAAGEAFDKTAQQPACPAGGPHSGWRRPAGETFARPMTDRPGLDFGFSGLKPIALAAGWTSPRQDRADIARLRGGRGRYLAIKCERALAATGARALVVASVGANRHLRQPWKR